MEQHVHIAPADAADQAEAIKLLYSNLLASERRRQIGTLRDAIRAGEISLDHLMTARDGSDLVGVVLAVSRPGRSAFIWPPVVRRKTRIPEEEIEQQLLVSTAARLDAQGIAFTQCLLAPWDSDAGDVLARAGFPRVTELLLLEKSLGREIRADAAVDGPIVLGASRGSGSRAGADSLQVESVFYSLENHAQFSQLVEQTYVGTLDCPFLSGLRSGEDSLESFRATGLFDPREWRMYSIGKENAGMILVCDHPERSASEIAYLGVASQFRGRGIGRAMLAAALKRAAARTNQRMELAVDVDNVYAIRMYESLGFVERRRYAVHLRRSPAVELYKAPGETG
jgi:mycothiol synthase